MVLSSASTTIFPTSIWKSFFKIFYHGNKNKRIIISKLLLKEKEKQKKQPLSLQSLRKKEKRKKRINSFRSKRLLKSQKMRMMQAMTDKKSQRRNKKIKSLRLMHHQHREVPFKSQLSMLMESQMMTLSSLISKRKSRPLSRKMNQIQGFQTI